MSHPTILLLDNGSIRPESTLNLRRLAAGLEKACGQAVQPISLQHADKADPAQLGGLPAQTFGAFMQQRLEQGERDFIALPLFFGRSRALTAFIPQQLTELAERFGPFELRLADPLCPLPRGEPLLARILCDNVQEAAKAAGVESRHVVLVDHGSPLPEVTRVRRVLAAQLQECLGGRAKVSEAVMERRPGREFDFNGRLLSEELQEQARERPDGEVLLSLLFLNTGRHAGPGGDIENICDRIRDSFPGFRIITASLVGSHPALLEILLSRLDCATAGDF